ncbi:hypothetical protein C8F04DRAFT_1266830 [Mycena alexandri]|uniref:Uncharacterized protein n=1 Tax=Mycena alexandri TaxID=1745969 RepID=A0AAD6WWT8_9AGAR|nr:hypothetical protein C8F04DRAFT_1266830 [Mycena alexandri]
MSTPADATKAIRKKAAISADPPKPRNPTMPTRRSTRSVSTPNVLSPNPLVSSVTRDLAELAVETQPTAGATPAAGEGGSDAGTASSLPPLQTVSNSSVTDATESVSVDGAEDSAAAAAARANSLRSMYVGTLLRATNSRMVEIPDEEDFDHRGSVIDSSSRAVLELIETIPATSQDGSDIPTSRAIAEAVNGLKALQHAPAESNTVSQSMNGRAEDIATNPTSQVVNHGEDAGGNPVDFNESVTAALVAGRGHLRIFVSLAKHLDIFDEDLETSLARYHPVLDPNQDDDPLLPYGAEDGGMPGKTLEETKLLRDTVTRWTLPHGQWDWSSLDEGVQEFASLRMTFSDINGYHSKSGSTLFSLNHHTLDRIAQLTLVVHQILKALYEF